MWFVANVIKDNLKVEGEAKWEHDIVFVDATDETHALQSIAQMDWPEERYVARSRTRVLNIHRTSNPPARKVAKALPTAEGRRVRRRKSGGHRVRKPKAG